jgi:hypothetical protein
MSRCTVPRTSLRFVDLKKWFPSDNPLAAKIARVCILREDLLLEMQGVRAEDIKPLDGLSPEYRSIFFLRSLFQTYTELCGALQILLKSLEFKALLEIQPDSIKARFREHAQTIANVHPILKDIRNDVCGHVLDRAVQAALERIPETFGFLEIGSSAEGTHYKFAGELVSEMLLKDVSREERKHLMSSKFAAIATILPVFSTIDYCFALYAMDRGLLPVRPLS